MTFTKDGAVEAAKEDLAERLGISKDDIKLSSVSEKEFADMSLGAPADDEMAAQMITNGWQIVLSANSASYEYRADKYQLRLKGYKGSNVIVKY